MEDYVMSQEIQTFEEAIANQGLCFDNEIIKDGNLHRVHVDSDKRGDLNGWYVFHDGIVPYGVFGCWKRDIKESWRDDSYYKHPKSQQQKVDQEIKKIQVENEKERACLQDKAAEWCNKLFDKAQKPPFQHRYLSDKQIKPYCCRLGESMLLIPFYDFVTDELTTLQRIYYKDDQPVKRFYKEARKKGTYCYLKPITDQTRTIYIAEGFATAASILETIETKELNHIAVAVAGSQHWMEDCYLALKLRYESCEYIIAADTEAVNKMEGICKQYGIKHTTPTMQTANNKADFNDLFVETYQRAIDDKKPPAEAQELALVEVRRQLLTVITPQKKSAKYSIDSNFKLKPDGVYYIKDPADPTQEVRVCGRLEIVASTRDKESKNHGRLVRFADQYNVIHEIPIPLELFKGNGQEVIGMLLNRGLWIRPQQKNPLKIYIQEAIPKDTVLCVPQVGWHDHRYILPNAVIGSKTKERVIFQAKDTIENINPYEQQGTVADWREQIGKYCIGNSRLTLAVSAAFAAPLIHIMPEVGNFGIHFNGQSSTGKTTLLKVAASVVYPPDKIRSWHGTINGIEAVATQFNDSLLTLDELKEADQTLGQMVYMLGQGQGKSRANQKGASRKTYEFRLIYLSSGELGLLEHIQSQNHQVNNRIYAGQEMRFLDIPSDAGEEHGCFEHLYDFKDGCSFADHLIEKSNQIHGVLFRPYLAALCKELETDKKGFINGFKKYSEEFINSLEIPKSDSQSLRAAKKFALIGFAGELATRYGLTGWTEQNATNYVKKCFIEWRDNRGASGSEENEQVLTAIKAFFQKHHAYFNPNDATTKNFIPPGGKSFGYSRNEYGDHFYYITKSMLKNELKQFPLKKIIKVAKENGLLVTDSADNRDQKQLKINSKPTRFYCFKLSGILDQD